ncbi:Uma2 family endonuclease [Pseudonocardia sp.]|uniref:Uma2 family endonuclease n=1 Tax=Pseudonocardia sp. TaxID=60912 RepID=UPI002625342C|nr:Uma2 family endonuclease [Pseudonocardia sp.]
MRAMTSQQASIPTGRPFTVDDLEGMPDDGNRYEIIDGTLIVSPAPSWEHQEMGFAAGIRLRAACPRELRVLIAPFAVQTAFDNEVQPDVLVARFTDLRSKNLPTPPVMVAEVLSRSTQLHDRNTKKAHYERMGVPVYWLLDPTEPGSLTVFEHRAMEIGGGGYEQVAHVVGDEEYAARRPFPVTVVPARLLDGTRP